MKKSIGIIGFGAVTRLYHLPYILSNSNLYLKLIVDPIACKNVGLIDEFNLARDISIIDSIENLSSEFVLPDIFVIATPPNSHYGIIQKLLNFNKTILVEKPFLLDMSHLNEIHLKLESTNSKLYVNQMRRFLPTLNYVKDVIDNKIHGNLIKVKIFEGYKGSWKSVSNYNMLSQKLGGGNLVDTGIHIIDSLIYITNCNDFNIIEYSDDSQNDIPDSEFRLKLNSKNSNFDVDIFSTRNSNITPYYEFLFENSRIYFYLNSHNTVYVDTANFKFAQVEIAPTFTYEDAFSSVYSEILDDNNSFINSRISSYNNVGSIEILDKILNRDKLINEIILTDVSRRKILLFGGNSYVAKEFIKYAINNNFFIHIISRTPVIFNDKKVDEYIMNIGWEDAALFTFDEKYEFSINFAYDTTLDKFKNLELIKKIAEIINKLNLSKNFHLSSIAVYNGDGNLKSFNYFNKVTDRYSYIKRITESKFLNLVDNSVILRCGNFVGLDSPLWVNSFINFIIERRIFPLESDHNSNILLTDDFSDFVLNFDMSETIVDVVSAPLKWNQYINDLSNVLGIQANYAKLDFEPSFVQNIKDLLFLFSNNQTTLGYLKNSKIVEIFKNFSFIKRLFLSFRKLDKSVNSTTSVRFVSPASSIYSQSRWIDSSVKNVINSKVNYQSHINTSSDNYSSFFIKIINKF